MNNIAIYCGSSTGNNKRYEQQAYKLGKTLAIKNTGIVYGGAKIGLMGAVANGALDNKGEVIGVMPHFLKSKEVAHEGLTQLILVDTMHERKTKMHELSDGVIALPGGFGTMEELFEMLTWGQLGLHRKPMALLNINGFYDPLLHLANTMTETGFLKEENRIMLLADANIDALLQKMDEYQPPAVTKWLSQEKT